MRIEKANYIEYSNIEIIIVKKSMWPNNIHVATVVKNRENANMKIVKER